MKVKVNELTGPALDWAVAKCQDILYYLDEEELELYSPSTDWAQGGPIIERERIDIDHYHDVWNASTDECPVYQTAPTPLIAAMRAYVASKLGNDIEIPDILLQV